MSEGPRIVLNPKILTKEDPRDGLCTAFNEAIRIVLEENGFDPVSEPTEAQRKFFADTAYADDELQLRRTILARIATLDTSVKDPTDEQLEETAEMLEMVMEVGAPQNQWEQQAVQRLHDVVVKAREASAGRTPEEAPAEAPPEGEMTEQGAQAAMGGGETDEEELTRGDTQALLKAVSRKPTWNEPGPELPQQPDEPSGPQTGDVRYVEKDGSYFKQTFRQGESEAGTGWMGQVVSKDEYDKNAPAVAKDDKPDFDKMFSELVPQEDLQKYMQQRQPAKTPQPVVAAVQAPQPAPVAQAAQTVAKAATPPKPLAKPPEPPKPPEGGNAALDKIASFAKERYVDPAVSTARGLANADSRAGTMANMVGNIATGRANSLKFNTFKNFGASTIENINRISYNLENLSTAAEKADMLKTFGKAMGEQLGRAVGVGLAADFAATGVKSAATGIADFVGTKRNLGASWGDVGDALKETLGTSRGWKSMGLRTLGSLKDFANSVTFGWAGNGDSFRDRADDLFLPPPSR